MEQLNSSRLSASSRRSSENENGVEITLGTENYFILYVLNEEFLCLINTVVLMVCRRG